MNSDMVKHDQTIKQWKIFPLHECADHSFKLTNIPLGN